MPTNGFINLYKTSGITSNKALSILKSILKENNIAEKVGHMGTLDPIAEGVLPVALGRATRLFEYSLDKVKRYTAAFRFGISTDTLDSDGTILSEGGKVPKEEEIKSILPCLIGEIDQIPPAYSAKVVDGVRAYRLARQGVEVKLEAKRVTIYSIDFIGKVNEDTYKFDISCSGGTYIRSIARDMGEMLKTCAVMTSLIRTKSGYFDINECITIEDLRKDLVTHIIPMEKVISDIPAYYVNEKFKKPLLNGVPLAIKNLPDGIFRVYLEEKLVGIGSKDDTEGLRINTWLL
ncbi:MAG TPA: tRNA pseudouridine(55) synthase TruB [Clostridia bacterium]|nr:tRNA pseudouridine(55) synthase TruB [Clostridia bacterium]